MTFIGISLPEFTISGGGLTGFALAYSWFVPKASVSRDQISPNLNRVPGVDFGAA